MRSNVAFLAELCRADAFRQGKVDTGFIDRNLAALGAVPQATDHAAAALGVAHLLERHDRDEAALTRRRRVGYRIRRGRRATAFSSAACARSPCRSSSMARAPTPPSPTRETALHVAVDGAAPATDAKVFEAGDEAYVLRHGRQTRVRIKDFSAATAAASGGDGVIKAPMHGRVLELLAGVGDRVAAGQRLAVIEAMKMEHTLRAPFAGVVTQVPVGTGAQVVEGAQIMVIEPAKDPVK